MWNSVHETCLSVFALLYQCSCNAKKGTQPSNLIRIVYSMPSPDKKQQSSSPFPVSTDISDAKRYDFAVSPFCLCSLCISAFCESAFGLTERLANDLSYQSPPFEKDVIVTITAEPLLAKPSSNLPGGKRRSSLFRLKAAIENNAPYHVLPLRWKKYLIYIVSFAALFSPLSSNIYFPALNSIAQVRQSRNPG